MFNSGNIKKIDPILLLRIGLGGTLIYAGSFILINPTSWIGFVPQWIEFIIDRSLFLKIHAVFELLLGGAMILGVYNKITSLLAFHDFLFIIIFSPTAGFLGIDQITFRDFGLVMAAAAMFVLSVREDSKAHPQKQDS